MMNTKLKIKPILCRKGTMNNYAYVITNVERNVSAIVDASEAEPVVQYCEENKIKPNYIFTTHHHFDHVGGNIQLKEKYGLKIVGPSNQNNPIDGLDIMVVDGDEFYLGSSKAKIISAPGHTVDHVLWYFADNNALFTGDVLFNLCIGGLFEGSPEDMYNTLEKIKGLPDDVNFYPGHEYTEHGLGHLINSTDEYAKQYLMIAIDRLKQGQSVAPISLKLEKKCNPYLKIETLKNFSRLF